MSIRPAVSVPADKHGVRRRSVALLSGLFLLSCALSLSTLKAQAAESDAFGILQKMKSAYHAAKTLKGTMVMTKSGAEQGKTFSLVKTTDFQYKSPNFVFASIKIAATGAAAALNGGSQMLYFDGKNIYGYIPKAKQYTKAPSPPSLPIDLIVDLLKGIPATPSKGMALAPDSTINGHAVYDVAITIQKPIKQEPKKAANIPADKQKEYDQRYAAAVAEYDKRYAAAVIAVAHAEPVHFYIDKKSFLLLRFSQKIDGQSIIIDMNGQVLNADIPSSIFTFTPPKDSKLLVPQQQQMQQQPGGMQVRPGAPGASRAPAASGSPH